MRGWSQEGVSCLCDHVLAVVGWRAGAEAAHDYGCILIRI